MISFFLGEHRFLSNFWPATVFLDGVLYPSVEHAYQASKTLVPRERDWFVQRGLSAGQAKRLGKNVTLREDWEEDVKIDIMLRLLRQKFQEGPLRDALEATGTETLQEGNHWGDTFWGVCRGRGSNWLGRLLMQVREENRRGTC